MLPEQPAEFNCTAVQREALCAWLVSPAGEAAVAKAAAQMSALLATLGRRLEVEELRQDLCLHLLRWHDGRPFAASLSRSQKAVTSAHSAVGEWECEMPDVGEEVDDYVAYDPPDRHVESRWYEAEVDPEEAEWRRQALIQRVRRVLAHLPADHRAALVVRATVPAESYLWRTHAGRPDRSMVARMAEQVLYAKRRFKQIWEHLVYREIPAPVPGRPMVIPSQPKAQPATPKAKPKAKPKAQPKAKPRAPVKDKAGVTKNARPTPPAPTAVRRRPATVREGGRRWRVRPGL